MEGTKPTNLEYNIPQDLSKLECIHSEEQKQKQVDHLSMHHIYLERLILEGIIFSD